MSIQIRDLIEQLRRFDPTARVSVAVDVFHQNEIDDADKSMDEIGRLIFTAENIDPEKSEVKQLEELREIIADIRVELEDLHPIWDVISTVMAQGVEVEARGTENRNGECGNHAVIICEK